jgi:hypothetical protein
VDVYQDAPDSINSTESLVAYLEAGISRIDGWNKQNQLARFYNYQNNLTALSNITITPYNSTQWQDEAYPILTDLLYGVFNAIFEQFGIEGPEPPDHDVHESLPAKTDALMNVFGTVFIYFYIAAGFFLIALAIMYWFGKTQKTLGEWLSILLRTVVGVGLTLLCLLSLLPGRPSDNFVFSYWQIPIVVIAYFFGKSSITDRDYHVDKTTSDHSG